MLNDVTNTVSTHAHQPDKFSIDKKDLKNENKKNGEFPTARQPGEILAPLLAHAIAARAAHHQSNGKSQPHGTLLILYHEVLSNRPVLTSIIFSQSLYVFNC